MAKFDFRQTIGGSNEEPKHLYLLADDSGVFQRGDLIRVNQEGHAALVTAGDSILGVVVAVVDQNGIKVEPDSDTEDTWTVDSDNTTAAAKKKKVEYVPALPEYLFHNDSSGTLAQSNIGQYFDVVDETQVDQATATDTYSAQVQLLVIDPDADGDASKGLFRVVETQIGATTSGNVGA